MLTSYHVGILALYKPILYQNIFLRMIILTFILFFEINCLSLLVNIH